MSRTFFFKCFWSILRFYNCKVNRLTWNVWQCGSKLNFVFSDHVLSFIMYLLLSVIGKSSGGQLENFV